MYVCVWELSSNQGANEEKIPCFINGDGITKTHSQEKKPTQQYNNNPSPLPHTTYKD